MDVKGLRSIREKARMDQIEIIFLDKSESNILIELEEK